VTNWSGRGLRLLRYRYLQDRRIAVAEYRRNAVIQGRLNAVAQYRRNAVIQDRRNAVAQYRIEGML